MFLSLNQLYVSLINGFSEAICFIDLICFYLIFNFRIHLLELRTGFKSFRNKVAAFMCFIKSIFLLLITHCVS